MDRCLAQGETGRNPVFPADAFRTVGVKSALRASGCIHNLMNINAGGWRDRLLTYTSEVFSRGTLLFSIALSVTSLPQSSFLFCVREKRSWLASLLSVEICLVKSWTFESELRSQMCGNSSWNVYLVTHNMSPFLYQSYGSVLSLQVPSDL